mmetsp:Transcript_52965/g.112534  ORF Transcript_52965/g.112534 Transcript_52965/m.112534 type:complete len:201 (-) Transcript_52965:334-936(-)
MLRLGQRHELPDVSFDDVPVELDCLLQKLLELPVQIGRHPLGRLDLPPSRLSLLRPALLPGYAGPDVVDASVEAVLPQPADGVVFVRDLGVVEDDLAEHLAQLQPQGLRLLVRSRGHLAPSSFGHFLLGGDGLEAVFDLLGLGEPPEDGLGGDGLPSLRLRSGGVRVLAPASAAAVIWRRDVARHGCVFGWFGCCFCFCG